LLKVRNRIEALFRDVLCPLLEADGATIELVDVRDRVVQVRFGGSYRGCPSTPYTVAGVIVPALRKATGQAYEVEVLV
jgi:Fe-S cluster biogenesis protein NfuA